MNKHNLDISFKRRNLSHDRYNARQIFYIDDEGRDREVKEHMSYGEWLRESERFKTIKVEGLEETKWITECVDEVVHNITERKEVIYIYL